MTMKDIAINRNLLKKVLAIFFCVSLLFGFATVNANAATSKGLWYEENSTSWGTFVHNATVTPEQGANLNVWLKNDAPVTLQVYKTNAFGGYTKVYQSGTIEAGERDIMVVTNCNGKRYLVQMNRKLNQTPTYSWLIYQN